MSIYKKISNILEDAGEIMLYYYNSSYTVQIKEDGSPVTIADLEVSSFLEKELLKLFPNDIVSTEENWKLGTDPSRRIWLSDPLDGTKAFIERIPKFSLILSCIEKGEITFGCIYFPVTNELLYSEKNRGGFYIKDGVKKKIVFKDKFANSSESRILFKPSYKRNIRIKNIIEKGRFKIKGESAVTGYTFKEFLISGKYDFLLLADPYKFEIGAFIGLMNEAGGCCLDLNGKTLDLYGDYYRINEGVIAGGKEAIKSFLKENQKILKE